MPIDKQGSADGRQPSAPATHEPLPPELVGRKIKKGAAWMVLYKFVERGFGLISTLILVRLLIPADFGLVAMAMSIVFMVELAGSFGFDMALIQNQQASRTHYDTVWTFTVLFGLASAVALVLLAPFAADFYNEARLRAVLFLLAVAALVQGFENVGVVAFRKEMTFHKEFYFLLSKKLGGFLIAVPLAFLLRNYWALVAGIVGGRVVGVCVSYFAHPYRPRLALGAWSEIFRFSKWLFVNNLLYFFNSRTSDFVIGRILGPHALGLYNVAHEISTLPTTDLVAPINRAVYPGYAKLSQDRAGFQETFLRVTGLIALFALPAGMGIVLTSELIVKVLLGEKWLEAAPLVSVLGFFGAVSALQSNTTYVFLAIGKPRIDTFIGAIYVVLLVTLLIVLTSRWGTIGAAWAYLATVACTTPIRIGWSAFEMGVSARTIGSVLWRPVAATAMMYGLVDLFLNWITGLNPIAELLLAVLIGAVSYVGALLALWHVSARPEGAEKLVFDHTLAHFRRYAAKTR